MEAGKRYFAVREYKKSAIEFRVASQNMPRDPEPLYQLGITYLNEGASAQALDAFRKAVAVDPKHEAAQYQVALFEVGSNRPEEIAAAKDVLQKYSTAHPKDAVPVGAMAVAAAKLGEKDEVKQLLSSALTKDPTQLRPASVVVAIFSAEGDVATAKTIARGIADQLPNSPDAAILRAQVSLAMEDTDDADAQISRALALKPDFQPALLLRLRREMMSSDTQSAEETTRELAKLPEKRTWSAYARLLFSEGKADEGTAEFERVLKDHDNAAELRDEYAGVLILAGRRKQAEAIVAGTLAKSPKDLSALLERATLEIDSGNNSGAATDLKTLIDLKALSAPLSYQQSRLAAAQGDRVRQGDLLADTLRRNPRLFGARLDLADLLTASGKARNALTTLEEANTGEKKTVEYVFHHNMALIAAHDWVSARKGVDAGLAMVRSAGFLYQDGLLRVQSHDLTGARKSLEASFEAEPANPLTSPLLAELMREQGDSQKFAAMLRSAIQKNPGSIPLQNALGNQLAMLGDRAGARSAYEIARAAGDVPGADVSIARIDAQSGAVDAAEQRLNGVIKNRDNAPARLLLAEIEARKESSGNAVQNYLKAIEMQPNSTEAMVGLAELLASNPAANNSSDALFWAQKALALAPANPLVEDSVGWIYYRLGKYDSAVPVLQRSLQSVDRPVVHYHLAAALMKNGDSVRGRREYDLAVKVDPRSAARSAVSPLFEEK